MVTFFPLLICEIVLPMAEVSFSLLLESVNEANLQKNC